MGAVMQKRRFQKGVAASELAIALPILILVVGSVISIGRLAHLKVELDSLGHEAARSCALQGDLINSNQMDACMELELVQRGFDECRSLRVISEMTSRDFIYADPLTGDEIEAQVPLVRARIECLVDLINAGHMLEDTELSTTVVAGRN
ncbi:MAG: hypothetical protein CMH52_03485 [Myxococcales bacterium]|nr:hypothetical protein [Myxococcales bacterium]|tara:strand:+ start:244 stop:690 length:447 start_codon:yes stop_codon:yes gene_type:complete